MHNALTQIYLNPLYSRMSGDNDDDDSHSLEDKWYIWKIRVTSPQLQQAQTPPTSWHGELIELILFLYFRIYFFKRQKQCVTIWRTKRYPSSIEHKLLIILSR